MPPLKTISPLSLEKLCFLEILNHLKREIILCNHIEHYEKTSLLLRNRGLESSVLKTELECYLDKLPPILNEMVRQEIINTLLSKPRTRSPASLKHRYLLAGRHSVWSEEGTRSSSWTVEPSHYAAQNSVTQQILEVVINADVKAVEFVDSKRFVVMPDAELWHVIARCSGLRRLALHSEPFIGSPGDVRRFMTWFVDRLTVNCLSLTELVLKDSVKHWDVLQIIGKNCKHLTKLDLTGSRISCSDVLRLCVDPDSMEGGSSSGKHDPWKLRTTVPPADTLNPLCRTLQELILSNTNVRARGAGLLLQLMPSLTSLGDLLYTAAGLKNIYPLIRAKKCKTLNLKHAFYRGPSNVKLKILASCCPLLESLVLGSKTDRRIQCHLHLHSLSFKMLTSLSLENIHSDDIVLALQHVPNLLTLKIDCAGLDVSAVSRHCPRLRELTVRREPVREMAHLGGDRLHFAALEHVKFGCAVALCVANVVLRHARQLRTVEMLRVRDSTDEVFAGWLQYNAFEHLEKFVIRYTGFTRRTVDRMLDVCPKLTKLGELGGWDMRSWECRRIKDAVLSRGFDLEVRVYTSGVNDIHDILDGNATSSDGNSDSIGSDDMEM